MTGRYGADHLNLFVLLLTVGLTLIPVIYTKAAATMLLVFVIWRMMSKNLYARQKENTAFLKGWWTIKHFFKRVFTKRPDAKTHKRFKCPECSQVVRVPRGNGMVSITCPKCSNKFERKT